MTEQNEGKTDCVFTMKETAVPAKRGQEKAPLLCQNTSAQIMSIDTEAIPTRRGKR